MILPKRVGVSTLIHFSLPSTTTTNGLNVFDSLFTLSPVFQFQSFIIHSEIMRHFDKKEYNFFSNSKMATRTEMRRFRTEWGREPVDGRCLGFLCFNGSEKFRQLALVAALRRVVHCVGTDRGFIDLLSRYAVCVSVCFVCSFHLLLPF